MNPNLLALAREALGTDFSRLAGRFLGESPGATQAALDSLLPVVIGSIANKGVTPQGAQGLISLVHGAHLDVALLGNVAGLFGPGAGAAGLSSLLKAGTTTLVPALLRDKSGAAVQALAGSAGIKGPAATNLLALAVPLVLTVLKQLIAEQGLNASSLSALLAGQGPNLRGALDSRMTSALGYASPGAFVSGLGIQAAQAAGRDGAAVGAVATGTGMAAGSSAAMATMATSPTPSGLMRWLPWLAGAVLLLFAWDLVIGKQAPTLESAVAAAPAALPAPAAAGLPAKVYFEVGAAAIGEDGGAKIAAVAASVKQDGRLLTLTGYTDKTGDLSRNEELAMSRANAVREALTAAGVPAARIEMRPPMFVEVGSAGGDAEARRVDIGGP